MLQIVATASAGAVERIVIWLTPPAPVLARPDTISAAWACARWSCGTVTVVVAVLSLPIASFAVTVTV